MIIQLFGYTSNLFIESIISGILATIIFLVLIKIIELFRFYKTYRFLNSKIKFNSKNISTDSFDWIGYSMSNENHRIKGNKNNSFANIEVKKKYN